MKRFVLLMLSLAVFSSLAHRTWAQGLVPFRAEYHKRAKGMLTLINDKDIPVRVTLKPESFTSDESGRLKRMPLAPDIHLVLSQTSLRIPPKETRYVTYEAQPAQVPAWFTIYATFSPDVDGIVIATSVPHFAYITDSDPKPGDIALAAKYDKARQTLRLTFTSHSRQLAHINNIETSGGSGKNLGSLSVLPGKSTTIEARITGNPPTLVKANGRKIKLECPVTVE